MPTTVTTRYPLVGLRLAGAFVSPRPPTPPSAVCDSTIHQRLPIPEAKHVVVVELAPAPPRAEGWGGFITSLALCADCLAALPRAT